MKEFIFLFSDSVGDHPTIFFWSCCCLLFYATRFFFLFFSKKISPNKLYCKKKNKLLPFE